MRSTFFDDSVEFCHRGFEADETKSDQNNPGGDPQKGQSVDDFGPIDRCRPVGGKEVHLGMRRASSGLRLRKSFLPSPQRCEEGEIAERREKGCNIGWYPLPFFLDDSRISKKVIVGFYQNRAGRA